LRDDEATAGTSDQKDDGDGADDDAGPEPGAENPPVATEGGIAEAEVIEKLTPEGVVLFAVSFFVPHDVPRLLQKCLRVYARHSCRLSGRPWQHPQIMRS
jgi:hypothetical protein